MADASVCFGVPRLRPAAAALCLALLAAPDAEAQGVCGGARVQWLGGLPAAAFDRGPASTGRPPSTSRPAWTASCGTRWYSTPTTARWPTGPRLTPCPGLPLEGRRTVVVDESVLRGDRLHFCLQSADDSRTGERLAAFDDPAWWRRRSGAGRATAGRARSWSRRAPASRRSTGYTCAKVRWTISTRPTPTPSLLRTSRATAIRTA